MNKWKRRAQVGFYFTMVGLLGLVAYAFVFPFSPSNIMLWVVAGIFIPVGIGLEGGAVLGHDLWREQHRVLLKQVRLSKPVERLLLDVYCMADNAGEATCPRCKKIVAIIEQFLKLEATIPLDGGETKP